MMLLALSDGFGYMVKVIVKDLPTDIIALSCFLLFLMNAVLMRDILSFFLRCEFFLHLFINLRNKGGSGKPQSFIGRI